MIVIVCLPCRVGFRVKGDPLEIESLFTASPVWPADGFTCPHCSKAAQGYLELEIDQSIYSLLSIRDLTPVEAYATLIAGVGLPEDRDCRKEIIEQVVRETPIRHIVGKDVAGANRFNIDYMELWDGTRLYFGASGHGAIIYRITRSRAERGASTGG